MIENEILNEICLNGLKHILKLNNILIRNENSLLDSLLKYYKVNRSVIENSELKSEFNELLEYVDWRKIEIKNEVFEELEPFESIQKLTIKSSKHEFHRHYCSIPKLSNSKFRSIIQKYYLNPRLLERFEEESYHEMYEMKIDDDIKVLLECDDIKLIKILLIILLRLKNEYEIPQYKKWRLLLRMTDSIDKDVENEEMNIESLSYFIESKSLDIIYESCGYQMFLKLLNVQSLSSIKCDLIIEFLKESEIMNNEEIVNEIKEVIEEDEIKRRLLIHPLTIFKYSENEYEYVINQNISIKCECDGEECEFSIKLSLPNGLEFNNKTGEISGKVNMEVNRREYEIECKQMKIKRTFKISLRIVRVVFVERCKSANIRICENGKKITCIDSGRYFYHCYLNVKLENGIYHFKYKSTFSNGSRPGFGVSTMNYFTGYELYKHQSSLCIWMNGTSQLFGLNQVTNPKYTNHNGDEYEFIVNMKERTISTKQNNGREYQIFKNILYPLYPFVAMDYEGENVDLLSILIED